MFLYNFQKQKKFLPYLKRINNAQKDSKKFGTGINRDERKFQILNKYIIHETCKLQNERKQNNPMNLMMQMQQQMQQMQNNPQQMPQMPQLPAKDLLIRFAPKIVSRILFSGKSPYLFYSPWLEKMMKKDSQDPVIKMIILVLTLGGNQQDIDHQGYITRFSVGFVFNRIFRKILVLIFYRGMSLGNNMFKQLQIQNDCQIYANKKHGEKINLSGCEDLLQKYPDMDELSEVDAKYEDTVAENSSDSNTSNSKI